MPSGASGFMSHMSCCGGPPHRKTKMQESALPVRRGVFARACNSVGSASPPAPSWPRRIIASRRWRSIGKAPAWRTPDASPGVVTLHPRTGVRGSPLVIEQELGAVEHGPREVFGRGAAVVRVLLQVLHAGVAFVVARRPREERQVQ